ncbi:hypothetical protein HAX54_013425 [Datura stramonium]|uniref:Uncharacterized protein n=1 Tax=Datura stramonium TaxID=4076 RepID=A0ABS8RYV3_DATST|nr:hypothetical protein [Datura stramonium]
MAIDMISEAQTATSPRISFSHDLSAANANSHDYPQVQESLSSNGLIRPIQLQESLSLVQNRSLYPKTQTLANSVPPLPQNDQSSKQEIKSDHQKNNSFWGIKRSSSVHCVNTHKKSSSFWSLPLLSRSNSTGSVPNSKQKQSTLQLKQIKNSSAPVSFYTFPSSQKPPLRKNYGAAGPNYGTGIRISQFLMLHPKISLD